MATDNQKKKKKKLKRWQCLDNSTNKILINPGLCGVKQHVIIYNIT